eukprot:jgi/Hompol1/1891/HPOL_002787-RA
MADTRAVPLHPVFDTSVVIVSPDAIAAEMAYVSTQDHTKLPDGTKSETAKLAAAVAQLRQGQTVGFPTETVYGLGANATDAAAVQRIFAAKGRPSDNPLIVHVSSLEMLRSLLAPDSSHHSQSDASDPVDPLPAVYAPLLEKFWPGPLTILVPRPASIPAVVAAGQPTIAVRMPAHPVARALIELCGFPLAAPSANTSGRPSPTLASHVLADLVGRIPLIIDGGPCISGVESTVIDALRIDSSASSSNSNPALRFPAILRPGGITYEQIRAVKGFENVTVYSKHFVDRTLEEAPTTPGMKYRHYTPNAEVILFETRSDPDSTSTSSSTATTATATAAAALLNALDWKQQQRHRIAAEYAQLTQKNASTAIGILRTGTPVATDSILKGAVEMHLGESTEEVARNLFKGLRDMEQRGCKIVLVEGVSDSDHGLAVMNRIRKASSRIIAASASTSTVSTA